MRSLTALVRLCFSQTPSAEELYLMLDYNVAVPAYVREALFSRSFDNGDLLPRLRKPLLVLHGAEDAIVKPSTAEQHQAAIAHAQVRVLAGAGHAPFWDDAATFNQHLRSFCEGL